jgi:hypothetical protein
MIKLSEFVKKFQNEINMIPVHNEAVLTVLGFEVSEKVQSMIGEKQIFWADLKESTIERKQRKGWGKGGNPDSPLWATGEYHDSIQFSLSGRDKVQIFSTLDFVKYLEMGTSKMPPRPVFKPAAKLVLKSFLGSNRIQSFYFKGLR